MKDKDIIARIFYTRFHKKITITKDPTELKLEKKYYHYPADI